MMHIIVYFLSILFLFCFTSLSFSADINIFENVLDNLTLNITKPDASEGKISVLPEVPTLVPLSITDLNRIVCNNGDINDVRTSGEKGLLKPELNGNEAFLKFTHSAPEDKTQEIFNAIEIFVKCGKDRYTLIGVPKRIPVQTIYLKLSVTDRAEKNSKTFRGKDYEEKIVSIITSGYNGKLPDSWIKQEQNKRLNLFTDVDVVFVSSISIEGEGIDLHEYLFSLNNNSNIPQIILNEEDIVSKIGGSEVIKAISISEHILRKGNTSRVFLVKSFY